MLAFESAGSGVPLVFIHAFPVNRRMWDANREAFSRHFRFISLDLPGFGQSSLEGDTATMSRMAERVIRTMDGAGVKDKFIPIGVSMGGYVVFELLKKFPGRVRAAGLLSTRAEADSGAAREKRFKNIEMIEKEGLTSLADAMLPHLLGKTTHSQNPALVDQVREMILGENKSGVEAALRGMAEREDFTAFCAALNVPVIAIAGEEDTAVVPVEMGKWAQTIPAAEFHVIPKAGHLLNMEQPAVFHDLFTTFLKRRVL